MKSVQIRSFCSPYFSYMGKSVRIFPYTGKYGLQKLEFEHFSLSGEFNKIYLFFTVNDNNSSIYD